MFEEARTQKEGIAMIEATSCGGVVIFRGKILLLFKNYKNKYEGWVLPKGTVEPGEEYPQTAKREVLEETGVEGTLIKYIGKSHYMFNVPDDTVEKEVHWYPGPSGSPPPAEKARGHMVPGRRGREPVAVRWDAGRRDARAYLGRHCHRVG